MSTIHKGKFATVRWHIDEFEGEVDRVVERRLIRTLEVYEGIVQGMFREPKSGREYKITKTGKTHIASAPGEAPAIMFARLSQGIRFEVDRIAKGVFHGVIGTTFSEEDSYSKHLEFGTEDMAPRPAWRPALKKLRKKIRKLWR